MANRYDMGNPLVNTIDDQVKGFESLKRRKVKIIIATWYL